MRPSKSCYKLYTRWQIQVFCFCINKLSIDCYHFPLTFMNTLRSLVHLRLQYYICLVRSIEEEQGREREGRSASNCVFSFFFFHEWEWEGERTEIAWNNRPVFLPGYIPGSVFLCFALEGAVGRLLEISKPAAPPPSILPLTDIPSDSGLMRSLQHSVVEKLPVRLIDNASCPAHITEYTESQSTTETGSLAVCFTIKPSIWVDFNPKKSSTVNV